MVYRRQLAVFFYSRRQKTFQVNLGPQDPTPIVSKPSHGQSLDTTGPHNWPSSFSLNLDQGTLLDLHGPPIIGPLLDLHEHPMIGPHNFLRLEPKEPS